MLSKSSSTYPLPEMSQGGLCPVTTSLFHHCNESLHFATIITHWHKISYFITSQSITRRHNHLKHLETTSLPQQEQPVANHRGHNVKNICIFSTTRAQIVTWYQNTSHSVPLTIESLRKPTAHLAFGPAFGGWSDQWKLQSPKSRSKWWQLGCGVLELRLLHSYIVFGNITNIQRALRFAAILEPRIDEEKRVLLSFFPSLPNSSYIDENIHCLPYSLTLLPQSPYNKPYSPTVWHQLLSLDVSKLLQTLSKCSIISFGSKTIFAHSCCWSSRIPS